MHVTIDLIKENHSFLRLVERILLSSSSLLLPIQSHLMKDKRQYFEQETIFLLVNSLLSKVLLSLVQYLFGLHFIYVLIVT